MTYLCLERSERNGEKHATEGYINTLIAPMVKLAHSSREIARNDFGGEDLVVENRDEMGELVQAFNKMKSEK